MSLTCLLFGLLTFFTFINQKPIKSVNFNIQTLLYIDAFLLGFLFLLVAIKTFTVIKERKKGTLGSETTLRYIVFFSITTLLPSILIAIFSLFLMNIIQYKNDNVVVSL